MLHNLKHVGIDKEEYVVMCFKESVGLVEPRQTTTTEHDLGASYRYVGYDEGHSLQQQQYDCTGRGNECELVVNLGGNTKFFRPNRILR